MTPSTKLPPTVHPSCGTYSGYNRHWRLREEACRPCKDAANARNRTRRASPGGREYANASNRKSLTENGGRKRIHDNYRARTELEADADFTRLHPDGKACPGCAELLPADAFSRDWTKTDGRMRLCELNGCKYRHWKLKRDLKLRAFWLTRGIDHTICVYCQLNPAEDLEHFHPKALGGSDDYTNLYPACAPCNRGIGGKHDRDPWEWLAHRFPARLPFFLNLYKETS